MLTEMLVAYLAELGTLALASRLRAASERLYGIADAAYAAQGIDIEARWFPVLRILHDRGPQSVGALAEAANLTHSAVSQLANRLVRGGWVRSRKGSADGRVRELVLTAKAEAALRNAKPLWLALRDELEARCAASGLDVMAAVHAIESMLDDSMADAVMERARSLQAGQVEVVPFRPELRGHFYRLNAEWLKRYFYIEETDHAVLSEPEKHILEPGGRIFFAVQGEDVVGTCALMPAGQGETELTKMAVDPAARGLGVGRRLLEHAIGEFERTGATTLFLETNTRLGPAIRMYESAGFEHQKTLRAGSHYQRANVYMVWKGRPKAA